MATGGALALSVQSVGKTYRITPTGDRPTSAGEALVHKLRHPLARARKEDFRALTDVSLDVDKGQAVGIIGRNGAGKSTLLKILSRITEPTAGRIDLYGTVGSLLEIGTGFHPELTGRENVYLNGAILGMKRSQITRAFDSIVDFAQVEKFLEVPVKRYSSGMYVRLAFSVAAHLNPDILVVDEVLSVGDAQFQKKCLGRMGEASREEGRTVLFVSHNMAAIESFCSRCIYLDAGRIVFDGNTDEAIERYLSEATAGVEAGRGVFDLTETPRRSKTMEKVLRRVELRDEAGASVDRIRMGDPLSMRIDVEGLALPSQALVVRIVTDTGVTVVSLSTLMRPVELVEPPLDLTHVVLHVPSLPLVTGHYWIEIDVVAGGRGTVRKQFSDSVERAAGFDVVDADVFGSGYSVPSGHQRAGLIYLEPRWEMHSGEVVAGGTVDRPARTAAGSAAEPANAGLRIS